MCAALERRDHLELHVGNPSSWVLRKASEHLVKPPFLLLTGAVALFLLYVGRGPLLALWCPF